MAQNPSEQIAQLLTSKSDVKQVAYLNICKAFTALRGEAIKISKDINTKTDTNNKDLVLTVEEISEHEFHLKVAGDLLVFFLHTNIITLSDDYSYNKSDYVSENPFRKYLGQINVYNFMSDSLKFNRVNDPGYLLSRLMINFENRFIVEGDRQINFMFKSVSSKELEPTDLNVLIQLIVMQAVENDLVAPPFQKIRGLTLQQKIAKTEVLGAGNKIGFQMSSQQDAK